MNPRYLKCIALLILMMPLHTAWALNTFGVVSYTAEYQDNAKFDDAGDTDDIIHSPALLVGASHVGDNLRVTADYRGTRRIYADETFGDETLLEGQGTLNWDIVRDRLMLDVRNARSNRTFQIEDTQTPDNKQIVDQSSAKLTFRQPTFGTQYLMMGAGFENIDTERSNTNSERSTFDAAYIRDEVQAGHTGLSYVRTDIEFDNPFSTDYATDTAQLLFKRVYGRLTFDSRIGYTEVDLKSPSSGFGGASGKVQALWTFSDTSSVSATISRTFEDNTIAQSGFALDQFDDRVVDNSSSNEVFRSSSFVADYAGRLGRNAFQLRVIAADANYRRGEEDEKRYGGSFLISRRFSSRLSLDLAVSRSFHDFPDENREFDDTDYNMGLRYQANRRLNMGLQLGYYERSGGIAQTDAEVLSAIFSINYTVFGSGKEHR